MVFIQVGECLATVTAQKVTQYRKNIYPVPKKEQHIDLPRSKRDLLIRCTQNKKVCEAIKKRLLGRFSALWGNAPPCLGMGAGGHPAFYTSTRLTNKFFFSSVERDKATRGWLYQKNRVAKYLAVLPLEQRIERTL